MPALIGIDPSTIPSKNERSNRIQKALQLLAAGEAVTDDALYPDAAAARTACNHILVSLYRYRKSGRVGGFASKTWKNDDEDGHRWAIVPK